MNTKAHTSRQTVADRLISTVSLSEGATAKQAPYERSFSAINIDAVKFVYHGWP